MNAHQKRAAAAARLKGKSVALDALNQALKQTKTR